MLSQSSKYAIRAVIYLTLHSHEGQKFSPKEVAETIDIPAPFLAKTLQQLSKKGIISSTKGRNGGFFLTKENKSKQMISIVECIDGLERLKACLIGLPRCGDHNPCSIHHVIAPLRQKLLDEFTHKSLDDFAEEVKKGKAHLYL